MRRHGRAIFALLLATGGLDGGARAVSPESGLRVETHDPRAYGWQVGDLAHRDIVVHAPAGLSIDPESLPRAGQPGQAVELRRIAWRRTGEGQGSRFDIALDYQVLVSPPEARTLEMPPLRLQFTGTPRPQDLRVEAWPITVAPLAPVEVSPRRGLGPMQPDLPPPRIDTRGAESRLRLSAVLAVILALYLAGVYLGLPWWSRRHRPFDRAWRRLRLAPDTAAACREVHAALNRSAGEVLFAGGVDRFVAQRPAYAGLRDDLLRFFALSGRVFFAGETGTPAERASVVELCRRCRDVGRGAA